MSTIYLKLDISHTWADHFMSYDGGLTNQTFMGQNFTVDFPTAATWSSWYGWAAHEYLTHFQYYAWFSYYAENSRQCISLSAKIVDYTFDPSQVETDLSIPTVNFTLVDSNDITYNIKYRDYVWRAFQWEEQGPKTPVLYQLSLGVDPGYYSAHNPDVVLAGLDPAQHYDQYGWKEGRDPNAIFSTKAYEAVNRDVAAAGVNPAIHYDQYGWKEGRDPGLLFDTKAYLAQHPDVAAAGVNPLEHYLVYGLKEGRFAEAAVFDAHPKGGFDQGYYLARYADVAKAGIDTAEHYTAFGWREGRDPNAYFSTSRYLAANPDVAKAGVDPLAHYMQWGWKEGRLTASAFDAQSYLANNPDVAKAGVNPLEHWLNFGINEGRHILSDHLL